MDVSALFGVNFGIDCLIVVYLGACGVHYLEFFFGIVYRCTPLDESSICLEAKMKGMHNMRLSDTRGPHRLRGL